tara:strand:- start:4822 stop:5106 length:285 start_codon:yes stop_codon:yes gene_type:complete
MTIYVNRSDIKHVDITKLADKCHTIGNRLLALTNILATHEEIDITLLDTEFFDIMCGDATDEMCVITRKFNELVEPYKGAMLDEFLAENTQNGQ